MNRIGTRRALPRRLHRRVHVVAEEFSADTGQGAYIARIGTGTHAMTSMTQGLLDQLQGQPMNLIGERLGLSPAKAAGAVTAALPLLIGALGRNVRRPDGARNLFGALERDHMGQDPQSVLGSAVEGRQKGERILRHVFGAREPVAAQGLATAAGVAPDHAQTLLRWLAPVAMAYVAKQLFERRQRTSASASASAGPPAVPTPERLQERLEREQQQIERKGGVGGSLLSAVLDRNHDGRVDFSDLLVGMGGGARTRATPPPPPASPWIHRERP